MNGYTFRGGKSVETVPPTPSFKKESTLKGKNLLPTGSKFFPSRVDPILSAWRAIKQKKKKKSKIVSLFGNGENSTKCDQFP